MKNTASGLPAPVVVDQARRQVMAGVGTSVCMPFFLPQGGCPTPSDVVGAARTGAYD